MLSAVGLTLVFGVMKIFNMAHGGLVLLGAYLMLQLNTSFSANPFLFTPVVFLVFFAIGMIIQKLPINKLLYGGGQQGVFMVFIFTFGLVTFIERLIEYIWGYGYQVLTTQYLTPIVIGTLPVQEARPLAFIAAVIVTFLVTLVLRTRTGLAVRGLAQNNRLASSLGVKVENISVLVFGLYAGLAALSGSFLMLFTVASPSISGSFTIVGFAVVLLGGMGSVPGALIASLLVGVVQSFTSFFIDPVLIDAVTFIILIAILAIRPIGLLGKAGGSGL